MDLGGIGARVESLALPIMSSLCLSREVASCRVAALNACGAETWRKAEPVARQ